MVIRKRSVLLILLCATLAACSALWGFEDLSTALDAGMEDVITPVIDGGPEDTSTTLPDADASKADGAEAGDAVLTADPASFAFGDVNVDEASGAIKWTIRNTGTVKSGMPILTPSGSSSQFPAATTCTAPIAPGASCVVSIQFTPTSLGSKSASYTLNAIPGGSVSISVTGAGANGSLTSAQTDLSLGSAAVNATSPTTQTWTIANTGNGATATPVLTSSGNAGDFGVTNNCMSAIGAGSSCTIVFSFTPLAAGNRSATFTLAAGAAGSKSVTVTGTGLTGMLSSGQTTLAFGSVNMGTQSGIQTWTVTNTGGATSPVPTFSQMGDTGEFIATNGCTAPLAPSDSCSVSVRFAPTTSGATKTATYTLMASPGGSVSVNATGIGATGTLSSMQSALGFGNAEVSTTSGTTLTWTINNTGGAATGVPMALVSTGHTGDFTITNNCTSAIPANNGSCTIVFGFKPTAGGARSATHTLSASPGGSISVTTTGNGQFKLTVSVVRAGSSKGTVTTTPSGFTCTTGSCTKLFDANTPVTVMARTANGEDSYFRAWGGAVCSGSFHDCAVTMSANQSVTANFEFQTNNLVFFTSTTYPGNLGGFQPYDDACNVVASAAGINNGASNGFVAWVATPTSLPQDRIFAKIPTARGWRRLDGKPVSLLLATNGIFSPANVIWYPIRLTEQGTLDDNAAGYTWTGADDDGTLYIDNCGGFTSSGANGAVGWVGGGPEQWTPKSTKSCASSYSIYCFGATKGTAPNFLIPTNATGKMMWQSGSAVSAYIGLTAMNSVCKNSKPSSAADGKAFISTPTASAASLLDPTKTYITPQLQPIATGAELQAGAIPATGIWQKGDATFSAGDYSVWTGSAAVNVVGTSASTCNTWSTTSGVGTDGRVATLGSWWSVGADEACNASRYLYCYEP